jgi:hypothetical protein
MKELKDLAKQYRKSAAEAIYPGLPYSKYKRAPNSPLPENPSGQGSRAFSTGNLLTKFITSPQNALDNIIRPIINGFEIVVDVAPNGAEYGSYVHFGTNKMLPRPFAQIAADDPKFQIELGLFMQQRAGDFVQEEVERMDSMFKKAGFTVS